MATIIQDVYSQQDPSPVALDSSTVAGNLVVVLLFNSTYGASGILTSVTDDAGDVFKSAGAFSSNTAEAPSPYTFEIWYAITKGGATQVSLNAPVGDAANSNEVEILEVQASAGMLWFFTGGAGATNITPGANTITTPTISTSAANSFVIAGVGDDDAEISVTPTPPFIFDATTSFVGGIAWILDATPGSYAATFGVFNGDPTTNPVASIATFAQETSAPVSSTPSDFLATAGISTTLADINPTRIESAKTSIIGTNLGTEVIG